MLNTWWVILPLVLSVTAVFWMNSTLPEQSRELAELVKQKRALSAMQGVQTFENGASFEASRFETWTQDGKIYIKEK
ncbi:MAG: hypothetical protein EOM03_17970 [Clostridia bacterium]|nr:hypothetical protein [Clostridia bacterium]